MTEASTKKRMKKGKIFFRSKVPLEVLLPCLDLPGPPEGEGQRDGDDGQGAGALDDGGVLQHRAVGAVGRVSQVDAAAVTEEVSLIAVPRKEAEALAVQAKWPRQRWGKSRAASTLKRKITEMAWAISSSSAPMTGAVAAMAEPPQMEEPTPTRVGDIGGASSSSL